MFYVYLVLAAALVPLTDLFFDVLRQPYSWWLVPLLFLGYFVVFLLLHAGVFALSVALVNVNKPADRFDRYYRFLVRHTVPLILKVVRVKVNLVGAEKISPDRKMFFVCNHQHDFDPVILLAAFPDNEIGFIGKKEIYRELPFVAKAMHKLHCLPIDRENDREAAKTIIEASHLLKDRKISVALFPEGYTNKPCWPLLPFRNGAFKIAYRGDAPIAVCVINNTRSIPKRMFLRKTVVDLQVIEVIEPEEFKPLHTVELGDRIHARMEETLKGLRKIQEG